MCQPRKKGSCEEITVKVSAHGADIKGGKFCDKASNLQLEATSYYITLNISTQKNLELIKQQWQPM